MRKTVFRLAISSLAFALCVPVGAGAMPQAQAGSARHMRHAGKVAARQLVCSPSGSCYLILDDGTMVPMN